MDFTPKQAEFLKNVLNTKSDTFGNFKQSALKAGYSESYADNITVEMPEWLEFALGKSRVVIKAEKNLEMALDGLLDDPEGGPKNLQYKATEFSLKHLRKEDYGDKLDLTSKGKEITAITWLPPKEDDITSN